MTDTRELDVITEALAIIDRGLGEMLHRELVSTDEVADLLLDVRTLLSAPANPPPTRPTSGLRALTADGSVPRVVVTTSAHACVRERRCRGRLASGSVGSWLARLRPRAEPRARRLRTCQFCSRRLCCSTHASGKRSTLRCRDLHRCCSGPTSCGQWQLGSGCVTSIAWLGSTSGDSPHVAAGAVVPRHTGRRWTGGKRCASLRTVGLR